MEHLLMVYFGPQHLHAPSSNPSLKGLLDKALLDD